MIQSSLVILLTLYLFPCLQAFESALIMKVIFSLSGYAGRRRTVLDIGFGSGDSIIGMACADPEALFIGVELHKASIASTLQQIHAQNLNNVKVLRCDAARLLGKHLQAACLDEVCILFPDPWPK